jgi:hypothetical protein
MMTDRKISISEEFRSQLQYIEALDRQSDEEPLEYLLRKVPVTSEKNVWTYWHSGFKSMPAWCQRNIFGWVRLNGSSWTVRVLDSVPSSPNNALEWVNAEQLPESFVKGTIDGHYVGQHSADFLRGAALFNHGGVWLGVGIILIGKLDDICWKQLEDPNSPFEVSAP